MGGSRGAGAACSTKDASRARLSRGNLQRSPQRLFALDGAAQALLAGTKALQRGHLRFAADSAYHAIPILAHLKAKHGGISFALAIGSSATVLKQLLDYEADVAVMAKLTSDPRLHTIQFRRDRLVLFVPRTHPWAKRARFKLADLQDQELVLRERGSITRERRSTSGSARIRRLGGLAGRGSRSGRFNEKELAARRLTWPGNSDS